MTQRKKQILAVVFAWMIAASSLVLWSNAVSDAVRDYVGGLIVLEDVRVVDSAIGTVIDLRAGIAGSTDNKYDKVRSDEGGAAAFKLNLADQIGKGVVMRGAEYDEVNFAGSGGTSSEGELGRWELKEWLEVTIPSISVRAPVLIPSRKYWDMKAWDLLEEQMQVGLLHGATAYPHSAGPGFKGTVFIAGHSSPPHERAKDSAYGDLFAGLPSLARGDKVMVKGNGSVVTYEVLGSDIVDAGDTSVLAQQSEKGILKLITCYPVGSTKQRLVVTAVRTG